MNKQNKKKFKSGDDNQSGRDTPKKFIAFQIKMYLNSSTLKFPFRILFNIKPKDL